MSRFNFEQYTSGIVKDMESMADNIANQLLMEGHYTEQQITEGAEVIEKWVVLKYGNWYDWYNSEAVEEIVPNLLADKEWIMAINRLKERQVESVYESLTDIPKYYKEGLPKGFAVDLDSIDIEEVISNIESQNKEFNEDTIKDELLKVLKDKAETGRI